MTPQQIDALKLALEASEWIAAQRTGGMIQRKAMEPIVAIREVLKDHAMQEVQRLGQEIEQEPYSVQQAYAMAKVCLDLHKAIGCKWGDNVYLAIVRLKAAAQPPQCTEQTPQRKPLTLEELAEALNVDYLENQQIKDARAIEAKLKEKNT